MNGSEMGIVIKKNIRHYLKSTSHILRSFPVVHPRLFDYGFILLITTLVFAPLLIQGVPYGHDIDFHIYRYKGFWEAIKDGQMLPHVDPNAIGGYGYAWNIFYSPLSTCLVILMRVISFSWANAINLYTLLTLVLSGAFMYRLVKEIFTVRLIALIAALIYVFAPYRFTDIFVRQAQGELLAFVFIPLLFLGLYNIIKAKKWGWPLVVISSSGLILSHNVTVIMLIPILALFAIFNYRSVFNLSFIKKAIFSSLVILCLTSFFLLPLLEAKNHGTYNIFQERFMAESMGMTEQIVEKSAINPTRFFSPSNFSEDEQYLTETMRLHFGAIYILGAITALLFAGKLRRDSRRVLIHLSILGGVSVLFITPLIDWGRLPSLFLSIQFPWRYMIFVTFFISITSAVGLYFLAITLGRYLRLSINILVPMSLAAVFIGTLQPDLLRYSYMKDRMDITFDYSVMNKKLFDKAKYSGKTQYYAGGTPLYTRGIATGEYLPKTAANPNYLIARSNEPLAISGDITSHDTRKVGTHFSSRISSQNGAEVEIPYIYYPGYTAYLKTENKDTRLSVFEEESRGLVRLKVPEKTTNATIEVSYGLSRAAKIGLTLSILAWLAGVAFLVRVTRNTHQKPTKHSRPTVH